MIIIQACPFLLIQKERENNGTVAAQEVPEDEDSASSDFDEIDDSDEYRYFFFHFGIYFIIYLLICFKEASAW